MLIIFSVILAVLAAVFDKNKDFKKLKFSYAFFFIIGFFVMNEMKMYLFYSLECINDFLFIYVIVEYGLLFTFAISFIKHISTSIVAVGGLMNFAVITTNLSIMPVSATAKNMGIMKLFNTWMSVDHSAYTLVNERVSLWYFSDIIPIPMFTTGLLSLGDLLIAIGFCMLIFSIIPDKKTPKRVRHARKTTTKT